MVAIQEGFLKAFVCTYRPECPVVDATTDALWTQAGLSSVVEVGKR